MLLGPGHAPATYLPEHLFAVLRQIPLPELVLQVFFDAAFHAGGVVGAIIFDAEA